MRFGSSGEIKKHRRKPTAAQSIPKEIRLKLVKKILFLHGWTNKRPEGNWMRIAAAASREQGHQVWYPQFPNPDNPNPQDWQELLAQESQMMDELEGEKIAIAHSLGTINFLYGALNNIFKKPFDRVLLVAIPDPKQSSQTPEIQGAPLDFLTPGLSSQLAKWSNNTQIVASNLDRWQPNGTDFYSSLGIPTEVIQGAGHFSLDDGYGKWQGLVDWVETRKSSSLQLKG
jgi:predicted alpha/beta hydrolase family esterase